VSPTFWPEFEPGSGHVGFVVEKAALGQVFSQYFEFPCQSFHRPLHTQHHPSSGAVTVGQRVADIPSGPSLTPTQESKKKKNVVESATAILNVIVDVPEICARSVETLTADCRLVGITLLAKFPLVCKRVSSTSQLLKLNTNSLCATITPSSVHVTKSATR
jgi:hypothetical protein